MRLGKLKARILVSGRIDRCALQLTPIALCTMVFAWWKPWPVQSTLRTGCPIIASSTHSIARSRNTFVPTTATTGWRSTFGRRPPRMPSSGKRTRLGRALPRTKSLRGMNARTWKHWKCFLWMNMISGRTWSPCAVHSFTKKSRHLTLSSTNCCQRPGSDRSTSPTFSVWRENQLWRLLASTSPLTTRGNAVLIASIRRPLTHPRRGTSRAGGMYLCWLCQNWHAPGAGRFFLRGCWCALHAACPWRLCPTCAAHARSFDLRSSPRNLVLSSPWTCWAMTMWQAPPKVPSRSDLLPQSSKIMPAHTWSRHEKRGWHCSSVWERTPTTPLKLCGPRPDAEVYALDYSPRQRRAPEHQAHAGGDPNWKDSAV